jgi:hypothetical protein
LQQKFLCCFADQVDTSCPNDCSGRGECQDDHCQCYPGFTGWDCSQSKSISSFISKRVCVLFV